MNGRHVAAQGRVQQFVRLWNAKRRPAVIWKINDYVDLTIVDLETLMKPRVVVRTLPELQALAVGTIIVVQSGRAAQVGAYEDCDEHGELIVVKQLLYVGTDLYDGLTAPSKEERDTLRRMLPAVVIHPLD